MKGVITILWLHLKERILIFLETQTEVFLGEMSGICFKIIHWAQGGVLRG